MGWEQVTRKYYCRVCSAPLTARRKLGFCYMFHLRWVLLLAALMAAVINPVITSPFVYPLPTWSPTIQTLCYTMLGFYLFVAVLGLATAVWHERRPSVWLWTALFFAFGWLYVALHFALHTVAFLKVVTGNIGSWTVTSRSADTGGGSPHTGGARPPAGGGQLREPLLG